MKKNNDSRTSTKDIVTKGSIIALLVTIPSLTTFGISWYVLEDLFPAIIIGAITHFIAMGFSFKISKKFFVQTTDTTKDL